MIQIARIDHLVLTVNDIEATCAFYTRVLGLAVISFRGGRKALQFGTQKINLHQVGHEIFPHAHAPTPGSVDLCLIADNSMDTILAHLNQCNVPLIEGPVKRTGTLGELLSVYFQDPDGNLIEVSVYPS